MSHELTMRGKKAEMAYVGETPWHGLGQRLTVGAPIETWITEAGMDWKIQRSKVRYYADREGAKQLEMPEQHVLFRSDTKAPLSIVSNAYHVVQPVEVMEFFRDLVGAGGFELETAGTMFGGRRFWALAKTGERAPVLGQDMVGAYLLLTTSCDKSSATEAFFTTVRVVCNNTLTMALGSKKAAQNRVSVSHRMKFDPKAAKQQLGIVHGAFGEFIATARTLAKKPVSTAKAGDMLVQLLSAKPEVETPEQTAERVAKARDKDAYQKILALFNGTGKGATMDGAKGTAWGWLNGVTEFVDHHRKADSVDHRWAAAIDGQGAALKERAMAIALDA